MSAHAQLSPSAAVRWMACPGSVALCNNLPETSSSFADEGTDAHELAAICLETASDAHSHLGKRMSKGNVVGTEMADAVRNYQNMVDTVVTESEGRLLVEQRLPISRITGEQDAYGTADAVIIAKKEVIVIDLKYGRGVAVEADHNPQLQIYGLAALHLYGLADDFERVRMVIHQPRLGVVSEWTQNMAQMEAFSIQVAEAAARTRTPDARLNPTDNGCKFCKAKAICPAIREEALASFEGVNPNLATSDVLASVMQKASRIEAWVKSVRVEVQNRLLAGELVPGFKLVSGRAGSRAWVERSKAEALLKSMRIPHHQMYEYQMISPTTADKLAKSGTIGPRQWPKVQALITQSEGKPSVAPESDKSPALVMSAAASDFDDMTSTTHETTFA